MTTPRSISLGADDVTDSALRGTSIDETILVHALLACQRTGKTLAETVNDLDGVCVLRLNRLYLFATYPFLS